MQAPEDPPQTLNPKPSTRGTLDLTGVRLSLAAQVHISGTIRASRCTLVTSVGNMISRAEVGFWI